MKIFWKNLKRATLYDILLYDHCVSSGSVVIYSARGDRYFPLSHVIIGTSNYNTLLLVRFLYMYLCAFRNYPVSFLYNLFNLYSFFNETLCRSFYYRRLLFILVSYYEFASMTLFLNYIFNLNQDSWIFPGSVESSFKINSASRFHIW